AKASRRTPTPSGGAVTVRWRTDARPRCSRTQDRRHQAGALLQHDDPAVDLRVAVDHPGQRPEDHPHGPRDRTGAVRGRCGGVMLGLAVIIIVCGLVVVGLLVWVTAILAYDKGRRDREAEFDTWIKHRPWVQVAEKML